MLKDILAYLAGFFDGEGTVGIYKESYNTNSGKKTCFCLQVKCYNTNIEILNLFKHLFGGTVSKNSYGTKICYQWGIAANDALKFLKTIEKYLIIKKNQALLGIEFQENDKTKEEVSVIYNRLKELKKISYCGDYDFNNYGPIYQYLAGLVDAEGSIFIVSNKPKDRKFIRHQTWIKISNSVLPFGQFLIKNFKGSIEENSHSKNRTKPCYSWRVNGKQCLVFLDKIIEHLRVKKEQAEWIYSFWNDSPKRLNDKEIERRTILTEHISSLNT
jgi:hypothetical protein